MKKSHESGLATHIGPESCGAAREGGLEAYRDTSRGNREIPGLPRAAAALGRVGKSKDVRR
jgi:hypothetical protein